MALALRARLLGIARRVAPHGGPLTEAAVNCRCAVSLAQRPLPLLLPEEEPPDFPPWLDCSDFLLLLLCLLPPLLLAPFLSLDWLAVAMSFTSCALKGGLTLGHEM